MLEQLELLHDELDEEEQEPPGLELVLLDFELLMLQLIELLMLTQELLLLDEEQEEGLLALLDVIQMHSYSRETSLH